MRVYKLRVKDEYFRMIEEGKKVIEVRLAFPQYRGMKPRDKILFNDMLPAEVIWVKRYETFRQVLREEPIKNIFPDEPDFESAVKRFQRLYPKWKENRYGVLAIRFRLLTKVKEDGASGV